MENNINIDPADFLQRFSTKVLWHFTGYKKSDDEAFRRLIAIAKEANLRISDKPIIIRMPSGKERRGCPISCMCDIPFKDLKIHITRYGKFGIAFYKEAAIMHGLFNPVLYAHRDHVLIKKAEELIEELETQAASNQSLKSILKQYLLKKKQK
mgnify:CR=1 FL=1